MGICLVGKLKESEEMHIVLKLKVKAKDLSHEFKHSDDIVYQVSWETRYNMLHSVLFFLPWLLYQTSNKRICLTIALL